MVKKFKKIFRILDSDNNPHIQHIEEYVRTYEDMYFAKGLKDSTMVR